MEGRRSRLLGVAVRHIVGLEEVALVGRHRLALGHKAVHTTAGAVAHTAEVVAVPSYLAVDTGVTMGLVLDREIVVPVLPVVTGDKATEAVVLEVVEEAAYCNLAGPGVSMAMVRRSFGVVDMVNVGAVVNRDVVA